MLDALREEINAVDAQLVDLFCRRMEISARVAAYKRERGVPVYDAQREREVLARLAQSAPPDCAPSVQALYETIFQLSRARQHALMGEDAPLTRQIQDAITRAPAVFPAHAAVACQGVEGAYGQQACRRLFQQPDIVYCRSFEAVFQAVESGLCAFGVLPIENSTYGSVGSVYDLMRGHRVSIVRATRLHVDHMLLARPGVSLADVREVYSHEQALGQCSRLLADNPQWAAVKWDNTAAAAQAVAESGRGDIAAIASRACAQRYGLQILGESVQDNANNYTRFICIAKDLTIYPGANRISLMLGAPHRPGGLYRTLARFAALGVNLTKLESRPVPGSDFEFLFCLDLDASVHAPQVLAALGELSREDALFTFLGSYAEA